jgi:DNA-binding response OmpR family regulator
MVSGARLAGLRVLVVEDEMLISMMIEDVLADQHCVVVGPFNRVPDALQAAQTQPLDLAVLDVNIAGIKVYPIAEQLHVRGIPFLLLTGYGNSAVPLDRPTWQACIKPFKTDELIAKLEALVAAHAGPTSPH